MPKATDKTLDPTDHDDREENDMSDIEGLTEEEKAEKDQNRAASKLPGPGTHGDDDQSSDDNNDGDITKGSRSKKRKELIRNTLGVDDLTTALGGNSAVATNSAAGASNAASSAPAASATAGLTPANPSSTGKSPSPSPRGGLEPGEREAKRNKERNSADERKSTEMEDGARRDRRESTSEQEKGEEFRDSTAFLKGTQSLNPHNDYSQNFVDTEHRPQNFIRDVGLADRFEEYPKVLSIVMIGGFSYLKFLHPVTTLVTYEVNSQIQFSQKINYFTALNALRSTFKYILTLQSTISRK